MGGDFLENGLTSERALSAFGGQLSDLGTMGAMWLVGVGLVMSASVENTIGILLMKRSFGESGVHRHNGDRLVWGGGLLLMVAGAASDFVAFGFAAQSLIAPLGATTLLCNALLAPLILGETVVKQDWISSAVIMIGCIIAIAFGDHSTKTYTFDELLALDEHPGVLVFISISTVLTALMFLVALRIEMAAKLVAIRDIKYNGTVSTESDAGTGACAVPGAGSGSGSGWGADASDDDTITEMSPVSPNRQAEHIRLDVSDDDSITEMSPVSTERQAEHTRVDAASDDDAFKEMPQESSHVAHEQSPVSRLEMIVDVESNKTNKTNPRPTRLQFDGAKQDQSDCSSPDPLIIDSALPRSHSAQSLIIDSALPSHKQHEGRQASSQWEYSMSLCRVWCCSDGATVTPEQIKKHIPKGKWTTIHGITLATAGGLIGACSVLFGKTVAELAKPAFTDGDGSALKRFEFYLLLVAMASCLVVQMLGLNHSLRFHSAIFVVPVYQTAWIMGTIIGGGVYFDEFTGLSDVGISMFVLGVCLVIVGVIILTYFRWTRFVTSQAETELGTPSFAECAAAKAPDVDTCTSQPGLSRSGAFVAAPTAAASPPATSAPTGAASPA